MTQLRPQHLLLALLAFGPIGQVPTSRAADGSFILTATASSFAHYVPTYLANGYWATGSSLLGTSATAAQMAGLMDYHSDDVSRPAAIPSWSEVDYFDGVAWLNAGAVSAATHTHYRQALNMRDGVLDTHYRWHTPGHATDVSVTSFVSQSAPHLAVVSLALKPNFTGLVHLRFTLRTPPAPQHLPLAQLWRSDILVGGNSALQRAIHSDLFYILENSTAGTSWPVAACGFSANYFGHVFWDNDLWVFPTLLLLHPARAKSLIEFRQRTLPQALARAKAHGYAGAMYPWEADPWSGEDATPSFAGVNADREIHVNGAVALAQWRYYLATQDLEWLRERAFPVIEAVADFWTSRASFDAAKQRYELLDVTSPEEDYAHVDWRFRGCRPEGSCGE
jgi:trehalose/maltose hydrolase-like predicted phosphorylase